MSDIIVFAMGCFVSVVVASAVGLLLWGAANEPRAGEAPASQSDRPAPKSGLAQSAHAPTQSLESKSPA